MFHVDNTDGFIHHVYNRGVDKRRIFLTDFDYSCFLSTLQVRNRDVSRGSENCLVNILAYCLMPNHYHLLIEELVQNGLSRYMSRVGNSYTKSFNSKYARTGRLFESRYKSVMISSDEQLTATVDYIHQNPVKARIVPRAEDYEWSSITEHKRCSPVICSRPFVIGYQQLV